MRALCWKELRENVKWALLAMVALGAGEMYGLYHTDDNQQYYESGITLCGATFLIVTTFGSAAVGFALGLLQILPELRRDQWASLLHRPVPRSTIFLGKVAAGLLLYALATLPPFLLSVWLVATPGHFPAPFVPGMVKPGVADICTGVVWYFAALALALQRDKWIGLRAFPALAAFYCTVVVNTCVLFHTAIAAAVLMALVLFVAGLGTMLHPERLGARSWPARLAFLAMVFYGACGFGGIAQSILEKVGPGGHSHSLTYELTREGIPVRLTNDDEVCVAVTDPDGRPLAGADFQPARIRAQLSNLTTFSSYIGDSHGWKSEPYPRTYRNYDSYIRGLGAYGYSKPQQWFYLVSNRSLIGYQLLAKRAFARFGQDGFEPVPAEPRPLLPDSIWEYTTDGRLVFWNGKDLSYNSLAKLQGVNLPLPAEGPVYGIGEAGAADSGGEASVFGVTLPHALAVYDFTGAPVTVLPYHRDVERWGKLSMGLDGAMDRFYLWYEPSAWIDGGTRAAMPSYIDEMNRQGEVLHTWTLPPLPPQYGTRPFSDFIGQRLQSPAFFFGGMAYQKIGALLGSERLRAALARSLGPDRKTTLEIATCVTVLSLVLAAVTLFRARQYYFSWPRAAAWTAFVLLFNVGGFITFLLAADWPRLAPCPLCGRKRPIQEDLCPRCGAGWPEPAITGMEVFDAATADVAPTFSATGGIQ